MIYATSFMIGKIFIEKPRLTLDFYLKFLVISILFNPKKAKLGQFDPLCGFSRAVLSRETVKSCIL